MQTYEQFAEKHGLTLRHDYRGEVRDPFTDNNARRMNKWDCTLDSDRGSYSFPYYMGLGLKHAPTIGEVLCCLALDASGTDEEFEEWAVNLGYDPDSRKAEAIYHACIATREQLETMLGHDGLMELFNETSEDGE